MSYKDNSIKKERSLGGLDTLGKGQRRGGGGSSTGDRIKSKPV